MALKLSPMKAGWLLAIVYAVGVVGFALSQTAAMMPRLIWVNISLTFVVLMLFHKKWDAKAVFALLTIGLTGFLLEVIGVKTGLVFGYYQYGFNLGYLVWDTPLLMSVTWITTVYMTRQIAESIAKDAAVVAVLAALLMVLLDYFIEPFAVKYGMWSWNAQQIPLQNYIAWFVAGLIIQYSFIKSIKFPLNKLSLPVYLIQLGFFILMFLINK